MFLVELMLQEYDIELVCRRKEIWFDVNFICKFFHLTFIYGFEINKNTQEIDTTKLHNYSSYSQNSMVSLLRMYPNLKHIFCFFHFYRLCSSIFFNLGFVFNDFNHLSKLLCMINAFGIIRFETKILKK